MLKYTLSSEKPRLPSPDHWLRPNYLGPGDSIISSYRDDPDEWQNDHMHFNWTEPTMMVLKIQLNAAKNKLNPIASNKKFNIVIEKNRSHELLRTNKGIIVREYGGEVCTNAWLKMYELGSLLDDCLLIIQKKRCKEFGSFHLAEAPGNFILALNHLLKTKYLIDWNWHANSYRGNHDHYLGDTYGLQDKFPDHWLYGADSDGDITSDANLRSFEYRLKKTRIDLVTSDVKYVPDNLECFDEEENINGPVQLGGIICSLGTLSIGGYAILKHFTLFESHSISWLWLMNCVFNELHIIKPETSRAANSEVYVVGIGYRKKIDANHMEMLYKVLKFIRGICTGVKIPALFRREDIPNSFVDRLIDIQRILVDRQIAAIDDNISIWEQYKKIQIPDQFNNQTTIANTWLERNDIRLLPANKRMLD